MMTSDFGFVVLSWDYNATWLIVSLVLFIGGFLGVIASFGGFLRQRVEASGIVVDIFHFYVIL